MAYLVRYFDNESYARAFVDEGQVLVRALSYFRDYEDAGVRADPFEGTLRHVPVNGLRIRLQPDQQELALPHTFEARAKENEIFVYCLSTEFSERIATRFGAVAAVVIKDRGTFIARIRRALQAFAELRPRQLVHQSVRYYSPHEPPLVDWALPERIALRKPKSFEWQREYRLAVPAGDAFAVENVQITLVAPGATRPARSAEHPKLQLRLGSLKAICSLRRF